MNNDVQTLVILSPGFAASEADSTCLPMQQHFVRTLKKSYPHLNIIILSFQYPFHKNSYQWFDTTVISFNGRNKGGLFTLLLREKVYAALRKICGEHKVLCLLSFWYSECALVGKRFADKNGIKHYCWLLGQDARPTNNYPKRIRPNENELIALSDFLQDEFERCHGIRPFAVIPPGIDATPVIATTGKRNIDILAAGSLIPLKQFDTFLEVVAEIKRVLPDVKSVLIGDGPEKNRLQNLIAKLGLEKNVSLAGQLAYEDVLQQMQRAKVFLHPSSYEGFSGVCQEALSCGAHVISFCKAMRMDIEQWHIVKTKTEMQKMALAILQDSNTTFKTVTPYQMEESVKKMMKMFAVESFQNDNSFCHAL